MNFEELATFPMEDDDWIMTVLAGGVITLLGIFILPVFLLWGYFVQVMRGGLEGESEPPAFDDWGDLFKDGLFAVVIMAVYQVIPVVVFVGLMVVSGGLMASGSDGAALTGLLGLLVGYAVYFLLFLAFLYVGAAGVVNYAKEDTIGAAFDLDVVKQVVTSKEWAMSFLFYFAMMIIANVAGVLIITAPFVSFYALSASSRAWGEAFASATGARPTSAETPAAEPV